MKKIIFLFLFVIMLLAYQYSEVYAQTPDPLGVCPTGTKEPGQIIDGDWALNCSHCISTPTPPIEVPIIQVPSEYVSHLGYCTIEEEEDGCYNDYVGVNVGCICFGLPTPTPQTTQLPTSAPTQPLSTFVNYGYSASLTCNNGCSTYGYSTAQSDRRSYTYFNRPGDGKGNVYSLFASQWSQPVELQNLYVSATVNFSGSVTQYNGCNEAITYKIGFERSSTYNNVTWGSIDDLIQTGTIDPCCSCGHSFNKDVTISGFLNPSYGKSVRIGVWLYIGDTTFASYYTTIKSISINGSVIFNDIQPTPQPTPTQNIGYCSEYEYLDDTGIVEYPEISITQGSCLTLLPNFSYEIPAFGELWSATEIGWEGFQICPKWVTLQPIKVFDLELPLELMVVPFIMLLFGIIIRL